MARKATKGGSPTPTVQVTRESKDRLVDWLDNNHKPDQGAIIAQLIHWFVDEVEYRQQEILRHKPGTRKKLKGTLLSQETAWLRISPTKVVNLLGISMVEASPETDGYIYYFGNEPIEFTHEEGAAIETMLVRLGVPYWNNDVPVHTSPGVYPKKAAKKPPPPQGEKAE